MCLVHWVWLYRLLGEQRYTGERSLPLCHTGPRVLQERYLFPTRAQVLWRLAQPCEDSERRKAFSRARAGPLLVCPLSSAGSPHRWLIMAPAQKMLLSRKGSDSAPAEAAEPETACP